MDLAEHRARRPDEEEPDRADESGWRRQLEGAQTKTARDAAARPGPGAARRCAVLLRMAPSPTGGPLLEFRRAAEQVRPHASSGAQPVRMERRQLRARRHDDELRRPRPTAGAEYVTRGAAARPVD